MFNNEKITSKCPLQVIKDMGRSAENYLFIFDKSAVIYLKELGAVTPELKRDINNLQNIENFTSRDENGDIDCRAVMVKISEMRWLLTFLKEDGIYYGHIPDEPLGKYIIIYDKKVVENY